MTQQWRIGIRGKQRKDVDIHLLMQAVIALGYQLRKEQHQDKTGRKSETKTVVPAEGADQ